MPKIAVSNGLQLVPELGPFLLVVAPTHLRAGSRFDGAHAPAAGSLDSWLAITGIVPFRETFGLVKLPLGFKPEFQIPPCGPPALFPKLSGTSSNTIFGWSGDHPRAPP
jgi:hypothetical protein